ncbi:MAG: helix-turn-helix domain-containing protein, partial [Chitinophagales bacterium]
MQANELQQQFFNHLKSVLPSHISMVDELTELLNLSYDSVYRRIRGEKPLALNELRQICEHYHVSLDQVLQLQNDTVVFHASTINHPVFSFPDYLKGYLQQLKYLNSFKERQLLYLCKDLPI